MSADIIPEGFEPFEHQEGYMLLSGPYYVKALGGGDFEYGFAPGRQHENPNGVVHGGALFSFVDSFLGHFVVHRTKRYCATITVTTEFMSGAKSGSWIVGRGKIKKLTGRMAFLTAEASCDGEALLAVTGVFRLFGDVEA